MSIFDVLGSTDSTQVTVENVNQTYGEKDEWYDKEIEPLNLPDLNYVMSKKTYSMYAWFGEYGPEKNIMIDMVKTAEMLTEKGFTVNLNGDNNDFLINTLYTKIDNNDVYLPYKSFNKKIEKFKKFFPSLTSYRISSYLYKNKFNNFKPGFRSILASRVNSIIGEGEYIRFMLIYTECGIEKIEKDVKINFATAGGQAYIILRLCDQLKIPVINVKNTDWETKLARIIEEDK